MSRHVILQCYVADIDECSEEDKVEECDDKSALCVNIPGSYQCVCEEGLKFNASGICEGTIYMITWIYMLTPVLLSTYTCPMNFHTKSNASEIDKLLCMGWFLMKYLFSHFLFMFF